MIASTERGIVMPTRTFFVDGIEFGYRHQGYPDYETVKVYYAHNPKISSVAHIDHNLETVCVTANDNTTHPYDFYTVYEGNEDDLMDMMKWMANFIEGINGTPQ